MGKPLPLPVRTAAPLPTPPPARLRVGGIAIREDEIAREMQYHRAGSAAEAHAAATEALVVRTLLRLEADRLGIEAVARPGESAEEARIRHLLERAQPARLPDEDDCRRYYASQRARLRAPDRVRLRHILLPAAPDDLAGRERARLLGEALIAELAEAPECFDELAARHSACPSAADGGRLGWIGPGETVPEFERQVFRLTAGLCRLPVESRYGQHVLWVDEVERGLELPYEACRARIAAYLEARARQFAIHDYLHLLAERHGVQGPASA